MARRIADESKSVGQIQQVGEVRGGELCAMVLEPGLELPRALAGVIVPLACPEPTLDVHQLTLAQVHTPG